MKKFISMSLFFFSTTATLQAASDFNVRKVECSLGGTQPWIKWEIREDQIPVLTLLKKPGQVSFDSHSILVSNVELSQNNDDSKNSLTVTGSLFSELKGYQTVNLNIPLKSPEKANLLVGTSSIPLSCSYEFGFSRSFPKPGEK